MVVKYNKIVILVEKVFMLVFKVFDNEISELLEKELLKNNVIIYKNCVLINLSENGNLLIFSFDNNM